MSRGHDISGYRGIAPAENTPEEIAGATLVVCGSVHTRDATDAKLILEVLGLIEGKENAKG